jgi:hypothetical protein
MSYNFSGNQTLKLKNLYLYLKQDFVHRNKLIIDLKTINYFSLNILEFNVTFD